MSENTWNEVVRAYEKHFDCLEAAREEYRKAVDEVIDRLKEQWDKTFPQDRKKTDEFEVVVGQQTSNANFDNFGKTSMTLEVRSRPSDDQDYVQWATITARVGKPWEGTEGTLELVLEMDPDSGTVLGWSWKDLRAHGYRGIGSQSTKVKKKIPLSDDDFTEQAKERLIALVGEAKDHARQRTASIEPIQKLDRVMKLVNGKRPEGFGKFNQKSFLGKTIYVQTNSIPSIPGKFWFWFSLDLRELTLRYSFQKLESKPDLPKLLAERLGSNPAKCEVNQWNATGELMSEADFLHKAVEPIASRCLEALDIFVSLTST